MTPAELLLNLAERTKELERRLNNTIREGKIKSVDHDAKTAIVTIGQLETAPLRFLAASAGDQSNTWDPPEENEQVVVLSPNGELAHGVILPGIYYDDMPAVGNDGSSKIIKFGACEITMSAAGTMNFKAPAGITQEGDVRTEGAHSVANDVSTDAGISLNLHPHTGNLGAPTSTPTGGA